MSISYQWWFEPSDVHSRYDDLVRDPQAAFQRLIADLGGDCSQLEAALAANSLEVLRTMPNHHGWRGTPGLWRQLILPTAARRIRQRHARVFDALGYRVPLYHLTRRRAERAWARFAL